jgi:hypothetical protein
MRTMYDSVRAASIPRDAAMVAGYVDGGYRWTDSDWRLFPNAVKVRIAVFVSTNDGVVLDVENGDATPGQAPGWVRNRRLSGIDPSVYCSATAWPSVRAAFASSGVVEPHYWIAAYPGGGPTVPNGAVAHQYEDVGPYDVSAVNDYWPGVDVMGTWFHRPTTGETAVLMDNCDFIGLPVPSGVVATDLNDAQWNNLVGRYAANAAISANAIATALVAGVQATVTIGPKP